MVLADELEEGGPALDVPVEGPLEGRDDLRGLRHVLGMKAPGPGHGRHARRSVIGHLPRVGIVPRAPEAGAIARVAAVVDVERGDPDAVARQRLDIASYIRGGHL